MQDVRTKLTHHRELAFPGSSDPVVSRAAPWQTRRVSGLQSFSADDAYCVYCHARAAGPCAVCKAICCGDCVDLVMGLTTRRAVCHSCVQAGRLPGDARWRRGAQLLLGLVVVAGIALLLWARFAPP